MTAMAMRSRFVPSWSRFLQVAAVFKAGFQVVRKDCLSFLLPQAAQAVRTCWRELLSGSATAVVRLTFLPPKVDRMLAPRLRVILVVVFRGHT